MQRTGPGQHEAPDTSGVRGSSESAGQRVTLPALRQPVHTLSALAGAVDRGADPLDVGVEAALGDLAATTAGCCRSPASWRRCRRRQPREYSWSRGWNEPAGVSIGAGNRERISDAAARARISGCAHHYPGTPAARTSLRDPRQRKAGHGSTHRRRHRASRSCSASWTSRSTRSPRPARRSTRSTSTRCPTATPAPTCTSR